MSPGYETIGPSCALATAFRPDGSIDLDRTADLASRVLARGCRHVALFGTTGEGPSIGLAERAAVIDALATARIAPERMIVGVTASAVTDAAALWRLAVERGCRSVLLTPPFYFKEVDDEGLVAWFAALFEAMGGAARGVILYTIPSMTSVPLSIDLVERLKRRFPETILGVKDSTGAYENTRALLAAHPDLQIAVGHEPHLAAAVRQGGAGSISGLANIIPEAITRIVAERADDGRVDALVEAVSALPVIPAVKALIAHVERDPSWARTRPPLTALDADEARQLATGFDRLFAVEAA